MQKVIIIGARGKMGQPAVEAINQETHFELAATVNREDDLMACLKQNPGSVVIDFTNPRQFEQHLKAILLHDCFPVMGTTRFNEDILPRFVEICAEKKQGAIIAPNFSLSVALMMQAAARCAHYFPEVEIIEKHHPAKLDAPSGTAIKMANLLSQHKAKSSVPTTTHFSIPHARGGFYEDIPIHAIRLPGVVAALEVIFGNNGETLTFSHNTIDRRAFMPGLILACKKVTSLNRLVYGLENLLDE